MSNDIFGPGPVAEWDDLHTFGMEMDAHVSGMLGLALSYDALTWRSDSPTTSSRIDSVRAQVTLALFDARYDSLRVVGNGAIGGTVYGDLGGIVLQEGVHGELGFARPVPVHYDPVSSAALAASLFAAASLEGWAVRPALFAMLDTESPGPWRFQTGVRMETGAPGSRIGAGAFYRYESGAGFSPTLDAVSRLQTGLVFDIECTTSFLTSQMEMNILTGVSDGAFGIRIAGASADERNLSAMTLEITSNLRTVAPGRRVLVPLRGPALRGYASALVGWWDPPGSGTTRHRFADYSGGIEGRLMGSIGDLEWELACAAGPSLSVLTLQPLGGQRSRIIDTLILLSARLEPAVRLGLVEKREGGRLRKTGIGVSLVLLSPGLTLRPYSSGAAAENRFVSFMVSAFSEVR